MGGNSNIAILGALASNIAVAVTKFIAASVTGSSAMVSEGIHSLVDAGNTLLLYFGAKRTERPPSMLHPFGYGKEIYFYTLIVAISLFAIGGGMSVYEGIQHILNPEPIEDPTWNYIVLGFSTIFTAISWIIAFKEFNKNNTEGNESVWQAVRKSKDPGIFAILFEDTADLLGLLVAFIGVLLGHLLHNPYIDGVASIIIGLILITTSLLLAKESKGLLIGESADGDLVNDIIKITESDASVLYVKPPLTMHMGPNDIILALGINFNKDLNAEEIASAIDRIEHSIRQKYPQIKKIFVEAKSICVFKSQINH